jgi:hypothetical protein
MEPRFFLLLDHVHLKGLFVWKKYLVLSVIIIPIPTKIGGWDLFDLIYRIFFYCIFLVASLSAEINRG